MAKYFGEEFIERCGEIAETMGPRIVPIVGINFVNASTALREYDLGEDKDAGKLIEEMASSYIGLGILMSYLNIDKEELEKQIRFQLGEK